MSYQLLLTLCACIFLVTSIDCCIFNIDISSCTPPCTTYCTSGSIQRSDYGINEDYTVFIITPGFFISLDMERLVTDPYQNDGNIDESGNILWSGAPVSIFSCTSIEVCNLLADFSGWYFNEWTPHSMVESTTGIMKIRFRSGKFKHYKVPSWSWGFYSSYTVTPLRPPCSFGTYGTVQPACVACAVGSYSTGTGVANGESCSPCEPGTFAVTSPVSQCTFCPQGTYNSVSAATYCTLCTAGTFAVGSSTVCTQCGAGTFSTLLGSNSSAQCTKCPQGAYNSVSAATYCTNCASGKYNSQVGQALTITQCAAEKATCYCDGYVVYGVGTNFTSPRLVSWSIYCDSSIWGDPAPTYAKYCYCTSSPCRGCAAGSYNTLNASSACKSCSPGTYNTVIGSTVCTRCASATYSTGIGASKTEECIPCKTGSFNKSATNISCAQCMPCKVCPPGTTSSGVCQPGTVVNTVCTCDKENAYFNGTHCIECKTCHPTATTLRRCIRGSTSDITICKCNSLSYGDGVTSCTPCPTCHSTQFLPVACTNNVLNPNSLLPCTCAAGTFSNVVKPTACTLCSSGSYQPSAGGTHCMSCPTGKVSTATNGITCV